MGPGSAQKPDWNFSDLQAWPAPMLGAKVRGSVVCSSSPAGFVAQAAGSCGAYSATKGGISSLVRCMAIDYAPFGIRVNAVVPEPLRPG